MYIATTIPLKYWIHAIEPYTKLANSPTPIIQWKLVPIYEVSDAADCTVKKEVYIVYSTVCFNFNIVAKSQNDNVINPRSFPLK